MKRMISIWFFVGCLLAVYGLLIFSAGIRSYSKHSSEIEVVQVLHLPVWWGIFMTILGVTYILRFCPGREAKRYLSK
jgi:hypothetical protein